MILGVMCMDGEHTQLKWDLLEASGRVLHDTTNIQPKMWVGRRLALCWVPRQIDTFDEFCQPSFSSDQTIVVICEGKIHNTAEIKELLGPDSKIKTGSSGQALAMLYQKYQDRFLERVNGKFVFALWDGKNERLLLGRDHLGIEPLFYSTDGKRLIFSSSLTGLISAAWVNKRLNHEAILQYLLYCYNPGAETFLQGVHRLPSGHLLSTNDSGVSIRRYWRLSFAETQATTEQEYCDEILDRMRNAIQIRLEPDRPPGVFLSGGTDSSAILGLSSTMWKKPLPTFSFRCSGRSYDESGYAQLVAKQFGTQHTEVPYEAEHLSLIRKAVRVMDEPFCDIGIEIGSYLLAQAAAGKVSYVFSGEGGDELFAGHPVYVADKLATVVDCFPRAILKPLAQQLQRIPDCDQKKNFQVKVKRFAYSLSFPPELLSHRWRTYYTPQELTGLCTADFLDSCDISKMFDGMIKYNHEGDGKDQLSRSLYSDYQTLVAFYLRRLRLLCAFSLESRLPLLDYRLVEYAARIPSRLKIRGLSQTKFIYKRALETVLPRRILYDRPKLGHSVPMKNWLREDPKVKALITDTLCDGTFSQRGFFRKDYVNRMISEHASKTHNHSHRIWGLLVLELWSRAHPVSA
jgi:asparagine synthase (glutamine-hydrolysing)